MSAARYAAAVFALGATSVAAVMLSNVAPRRDTTGAIIDAHDGNVLLVDGIYYYYAAGYGLCPERNSTTGCAGGFTGCGFYNNHSVNLYTSADLSSWTFRGNVLPIANRVDAILFSPKIVYNALTKLYVLWYNYVPSYSYAVATSPSLYGPFVTVNSTVGSSFKWGYPTNSNIGDFSIMLDGVLAVLSQLALSGGAARRNVHRLDVGNGWPDIRGIPAR